MTSTTIERGPVSAPNDAGRDTQGGPVVKRVADLPPWTRYTAPPLSMAVLETPIPAGGLVSKREAVEACALEVSAARTEAVREALSRMTAKERLEVFRDYCTSCGRPQPSDPRAGRCQCWNDD